MPLENGVKQKTFLLEKAILIAFLMKGGKKFK